MQVEPEGRDQRWVERGGHGQRVVQSTSANLRLVLQVEVDVVVGHGDEKVAGLRPQRRPFMGFLTSERGLVGHVEADHGGACATLEQIVYCLWVLGDVRFGGRAYIAGQRQRTAHQRHVHAGILQVRSVAEYGGHGGHRARRYDGQVRAVFARGGDDEIDRRAWCFRSARGVGDDCAADAVGMVDRHRAGSW